MRDWQKLVRDHLSRLELDAACREEVCAELAAHLEENYQSLLREGHWEEDAAERVLSAIGDWRQLKRSIEQSRAKEFSMSKRVAQFWLPAFLTLLCSMVFLMLIQKFDSNPTVQEPTKQLQMTPVALVYIAWLLTLPFIGAMGAYLSIRAGSSIRIALLSVVFPVLPYLTFFIIGLPIALLLDDHVAHNITIPAFFVGLSAWVIFPALALLAGGLPVKHFAARWLTPGRIAAP